VSEVTHRPQSHYRGLGLGGRVAGVRECKGSVVAAETHIDTPGVHPCSENAAPHLKTSGSAKTRLYPWDLAATDALLGKRAPFETLSSPWGLSGLRVGGSLPVEVQ
jgi:hypothetical protein